MQNNILTLETNKYAIKLDNFEGPLDLLCHLIDKNKMDIYDVKISDIADQYIQYINELESYNLEITSEFLIMASTLLYLKSKSLLPKTVEDEAELTEEELLQRIIEYKKYKEICSKLKNMYNIYSKRFYKFPEKVELPKQKLEAEYTKDVIFNNYKRVLDKNETKVNQNKDNIQKIAVVENISVTSKVKDIFRELIKKPSFVFNRLFALGKCNKQEVVTAFSGLLELSRRSKVTATQAQIFGDIIVAKKKREQLQEEPIQQNEKIAN